jgi:hypothetical protein
MLLSKPTAPGADLHGIVACLLLPFSVAVGEGLDQTIDLHYCLLQRLGLGPILPSWLQGTCYVARHYNRQSALDLLVGPDETECSSGGLPDSVAGIGWPIWWEVI